MEFRDLRQAPVGLVGEGVLKTVPEVFFYRKINVLCYLDRRKFLIQGKESILQEATVLLQEAAVLLQEATVLLRFNLHLLRNSYRPNQSPLMIPTQNS